MYCIVPYPYVVGKGDRHPHIWTLALVVYLLGTAVDSGASFLHSEAQPAIPTSQHPNGLVAADLDGDGDVDLAVPGLVSGDLSLYENQGRGVLRALPPLPMRGFPLD